MSCGWTARTPPSPRRHRPACSRPFATPPQAVRRFAPPTCLTQSWAPDGSPTRRHGCVTGRTTSRSAHRQERSGTSPPTRAAPRWTTSRRWWVRYDHHGTRRHACSSHRWWREPAVRRPRARLAVAATAGAAGLGARRGRAVATADGQRRSARGCGSTPFPPSPRSRRRWSIALVRRTTGWTSGSRSSGS